MPERRQALSGPDLGARGALERWFCSAPWGLAIFDRELRFVRVNRALSDLDGVPVDEHPGRHVRDVLPALADQLERGLRRAVDEGATLGGEEIVGRTLAEAGRDRRWLAGFFPLRADDGPVQGAAGLILRLPDTDETALAVRVREQRMRLAMEGTGTGFWEWDMVADRIRWSESLGPLHGLPRGEAPANQAAFLRLVHPDDRADVEACVRVSLERGTEFVCEFRVSPAGRGERWLSSRGLIIPDEHARPAVMAGLMADVTERRRREDALTFLAEAGEALAGSLDPVATLEEVARLAVPRLADWCAVQLPSDDHGGIANIAVAHADPEKVRWARELEERYPPDPDAPTGAPEVVRTGRSELYPEIDEELLRAGAQDAEHLEIIHELEMRSAMIVPLQARERTLGAITFIFAESGRQYSTHELELAEELGRRAGLAIDHARLYEREHRTAETLQRALLPPTLPKIPGHELAARYLPGLAGDHVGGDWYDAFTLPDGRHGIAIGDIGGRGVTAAALMGQVRNGLRAYALKAPSPAQTIADLRVFVDRVEELAFATVTYIVYDARTGDGVLASAGHLPTLVVDAAGGTHFTDAARCPPLGVAGAAPCKDFSFTLAPGSTFVLYTDGLVESRQRSIDSGLERLASVARASRGDVQRLADDVIEALPEERQDDIALLALRRGR